MTIHICEACGKFFNSDVMGRCPFCGKKVKDNLDNLGLEHVNV